MDFSANDYFAQQDQLNINPPQSRLYHFPNIEELGSIFRDQEELNMKVNIMIRNHNERADSSDKIQKTMVIQKLQHGVLLKCKVPGCQAYISFAHTPDKRLRMDKSDVEHEHQFYTAARRGRMPRVRNCEIEECYDQLCLLNFKPAEIASFIKYKFKITNTHLYGIKYNRSKRETIKNMLMTLSKYDHFYFECKDLQELASYYRNESMTFSKKRDKDVIILVSKKMKEMYNDYHAQYVYFSIFPDLVLETRYTKKLKYHHVGILYGEDSSSSVNLIFGIVFIRKTLRLAYLYIMEKLLSFLEKVPKVLITDFDPHLAQAIRRLQRRSSATANLIQHIQLHNSFISNSFQSRTSPQFLSILGSDLEGLVREADKAKHTLRLKTITNACSYNPPASQERIKDQIEKYVKRNSIISVLPMFIGLSLTPYSVTSQLRSKILDYFKSPRQMVLAVKAIFQIFQIYPVLKHVTKQQIANRLNPPKECSTKKQKIHLLTMISKLYESSSSLRTVSKALSQSAALCLHDALEKCIKGRVELVNSNRSHYYQVADTIETYPYTIKKVREELNDELVTLWRCECMYYAKVGLPCWHEVMVCLYQKADLTLQVNAFWMTQNTSAETNHHNQARGIPEHDVKFWNEHQGLKVASQQKSKQKIHKQSSQQLNNKFNIKIKSSDTLQYQEQEEEANFDNQNQGLNVNINDLEGLTELGSVYEQSEGQRESYGVPKKRGRPKKEKQQMRNSLNGSRSKFYCKKSNVSSKDVKLNKGRKTNHLEDEDNLDFDKQTLINQLLTEKDDQYLTDNRSDEKYQLLDFDIEEGDYQKDQVQKSTLFAKVDKQKNVENNQTKNRKPFSSQSNQKENIFNSSVIQDIIGEDQYEFLRQKESESEGDGPEYEDSQEQWQKRPLGRSNNNLSSQASQGKVSQSELDLQNEITQTDNEKYVEFNKQDFWEDFVLDEEIE